MPGPMLGTTALSLKGSVCALVTPFAGDGSLDEDALLTLIDWHLDAGTRALVVAGSTGEAAMLDEAEYRRLLELSVARVAGRIPVLAGTGAAGTARTLAQTKLARDCGIDAALVATPHYVRPTQEGLFRHFSVIADESGLPVVLYNVPARTACDLQPATVERLHRHPAIIGIKEAVADPGRLAELLPLRHDGFVILSGDDETACAAMTGGADGVVSVAANIVPRAFAQMCDHAVGGQADAARAIDAGLRDLYAMLGAEPNPIPAKWLLHRLGWMGPEPRLPLTPLSAAHHARADAVLANLAGLAELRTETR
ncbi:dihydrodipicolinate synthase [Pseudofulvimonas gallinarii]|jgi:4-hydroxy-tetrahydrodipicolinate synthase|uniref:4-hydroxy-tetrahydrodipicolinate synthase n=1 Tax=Pseudofulvimonas gallinarii TaxID=634155 RepID=A0A4R3LNZ9_9GAMM|nr:dihydrodipicolinate synthase [Pseudofulvimonas gallinarii]